MAGVKDSLKKYVSARRKKSLWFVLARKFVSTTRNEVFIEKYVSTIMKKCFFWQKNRKWFPPAGKYFCFKIDSPYLQSWFPTAEKRLRTKAYGFHQTENKFPPAGMKDLLKNMFLLDVKVTIGGSNVSKKYERMVFTCQKLSLYQLE